MRLIGKFKEFLDKYFFNYKWRCLSCGKEIFKEELFCEDCYKSLPFNDKHICEHCGRQTKNPENYCLTCKNKLTEIDIGRSCFVYDKPISELIQDLKYNNKRYLKDVFSKYLSITYFKYRLSADLIVCVPMDKKSIKKRGYNHTKLLAESLSKIINVKFCDLIIKKKETLKQVGLNREQRLKNLKSAFRIKDKNCVKNKTVLIVDDVTTTGATGEAIASTLKKAGATKVILLTIASVSLMNKGV